MHTDLSSLVFGYFNCDDFGSHLKKLTNSLSQQTRILHKTNKKTHFSELLAFWKVCMYVYVLNTW